MTFKIPLKFTQKFNVRHFFRKQNRDLLLFFQLILTNWTKLIMFVRITAFMVLVCVHLSTQTSVRWKVFIKLFSLLKYLIFRLKATKIRDVNVSARVSIQWWTTHRKTTIEFLSSTMFPRINGKNNNKKNKIQWQILILISSDCDSVILPRYAEKIKGKEQEFCPRCECKYENRNTTVIKVSHHKIN